MSNKFLLVFNDGRSPVGLNTEQQVRTYLERSVPDANRVSIYSYSGEAVRNGWNVNGLSSSPRATRAKHNSRWTEEETLEALSLRKRGVPVKTIGERLGRTSLAVYNRLGKFAP
jgi:hypothetical protein